MRVFVSTSLQFHFKKYLEFKHKNWYLVYDQTQKGKTKSRLTPYQCNVSPKSQIIILHFLLFLNKETRDVRNYVPTVFVWVVVERSVLNNQWYKGHKMN